MRKWFIGLVLLVIAAGGATYRWKPAWLEPLGITSAGPVEPALPTPVRIDEAQRGDLVRTVSAPGTVEPIAVVQVSSQVSAIITALPFREGDRVREGDVVVRLDPQTLVARLASAEASLRSEEARLTGAEADVITTRLEFERAEQLYETGDIPRNELESLEADYLRAVSGRDALKAGIEIARAAIDEVNEDLGNTVIESPRAGIITALNTEVGETAIVGTTNNPGSVIMEIADLSSMLLRAQVDETNIAPVEVGQRATVYINAYPDQRFRGTVERIGLKRQAGDAGEGFFEVEIKLDLEEGQTLLSGLTASCDIEVEPFFDVVKVPSQAVLDRRVDDLPPGLRESELIEEGATYARVVFTIAEGEASPIVVRTGPSDLTHTVIEAGLEPGLPVVTGPYRVLTMIRPGMSVIDETDAPPEAFERRPGGRERRGRPRGGFF